MFIFAVDSRPAPDPLNVENLPLAYPKFNRNGSKCLPQYPHGFHRAEGGYGGYGSPSSKGVRHLPRLAA